jgi:hypothetical protein
LYYRAGQFKKSLKVLHDGQMIVEAIVNSKQYLCPDFNLTGNLLIFMNLWKVKKIKEAKEFLEITKKVLRQISSLGIKSKLSTLSRANLNGIITLSSCGILCFENNHDKAIDLCEQSLDYLLGDEVMVRPLLQRFLKKVRSCITVDLEWVTCKEFDSIVLVSCFIPYITAGTPSIKIGEKVDMRVRSTSRTSSQSSRKRNNSVPHSRIKIRNDLNKSWWNNTTLVQNKKKNRLRRASETMGFQKLTKGTHFFSPARNGPARIYSPSVGSSISTPRIRKGVFLKGR